MKKVFPFIVIALVGVSFFTNPGLEEHKTVVKQAYLELLDKEIDSSIVGKGIKNLGMGLSTVFVEKLVDNRVSRDNYLLFSLTRVMYKGERRLVGMGVFGNVFLFGEPKLNPGEMFEK